MVIKYKAIYVSGKVLPASTIWTLADASNNWSRYVGVRFFTRLVRA